MDTHLRSVLSSFLSAAIVFSAAAPAVSAYETQFDIRTEAPENNEEAPEYRYYYSTENPYNTFGCEMPNCTAYAWGRIFEIKGPADGTVKTEIHMLIHTAAKPDRVR